MAKACRYSRGAHAMLNKLLLYLRVLFCFVVFFFRYFLTYQCSLFTSSRSFENQPNEICSNRS